VDNPLGLAGRSTSFDQFIPLAGCNPHLTLKTTGQSFGKEPVGTHSSVPADKVATQSSDDRLSSLLYLHTRSYPITSGRANVRAPMGSLHRRTVISRGTRKRAFDLTRTAVSPEQWSIERSPAMFLTFRMILVFMLPLMRARDFEYAISWQCHYAIIQGRSAGPFRSKTSRRCLHHKGRRNAEGRGRSSRHCHSSYSIWGYFMVMQLLGTTAVAALGKGSSNSKTGVAFDTLANEG
jgi:hypothetical protein